MKYGLVLRWIVWSVLIGLLLSSCRDTLDIENRYRNALAKGINSNERTDELLLGLRFDMTQDEVYNKFTELGETQVTNVTTDGIAFDYPLPELPGKTQLTIKPNFEGGAKDAEFASLDFVFDYTPTQAEQEDNNVSIQQALFRQIANKFRVDYRKAEFFSLPDEDFFRVIVQVDNNRRLAFFRKNRNQVIGRFTDLSLLSKEPLVVEEHRNKRE